MTHPERQARREAIIERLRNGETVFDLAQEYGMSPRCLRGLVSPSEIPTATPLLDRPARTRTIVQRLRDGETTVDLANEYGLSPLHISRLANLSGISTTRCLRVGVLVVVAALQGDETQSAVARRLGVSRQYVHQIAKAARAAGVRGIISESQ